jgi:hypothetical protein
VGLTRMQTLLLWVAVGVAFLTLVYFAFPALNAV